MVMSIPGCMATRHSGLVYIDTVKNYNTITDVTDLRDLVHTWHAEMYFRSWSETLAVLARERYWSFGHIGFKVSIHLNCTSHWVSVMYSSVSLWKSLQSEGNWKRAIQSFVYCMERIYTINLSEQSLRTEVDLNCYCSGETWAHKALHTCHTLCFVDCLKKGKAAKWLRYWTQLRKPDDGACELRHLSCHYVTVGQ